RDQVLLDPDFVKKNLNDLCASLQKTVVDILLKKLKAAAKDQGVKEIALAGGVSANSELRSRFGQLATDNGWKAHIPKFEYCTDNAAMIG
ncbi:hypothetical protein ACI4AP_27900, partial [Klebsiella pneumoniae]